MKKITICLLFSVILIACIPTVTPATPLLNIKWETVLPVGYGHFHPSMGDVDNDGTQELVIKYGDYALVLNGKTGALEWSSPKDGTGGATMLELADLNNDGTPEIIYCGTSLRVYARDGQGNLLWTSNSVQGEYWPGTPIVTGDINGDGKSEIFVVTADTSSPYTACITKLDSSGNIQATSEICYKPCWGGLALADANFDGKFEVYLGEVASRGGPGGSSTPYPDNPARGLSCYDANNLETLWIRGDLYHSTPAPVLIDVTGDGNLEVIGNNIINNGACVVNATNGQDIYNWKRTPINNHAKGTVWDIDLDGHVELISAWGYQDESRCTKDFTVLDLVTGVIEYRASEINNYITYPPTVGDIDGDGLMDILVATSAEEGHGEVGQGMFYAYNHNYEIIQTIENFPYGKQLWEPYCIDCDSDGLNEVIIGNNRGHLWCYDTPANQPTPTPKPWSAWYSSYRQGASINPQAHFPPTPNTEPSQQTFTLKLGENEFAVHVTTNSAINNLYLDPLLKQITFNVSGSDGTAGYCNLTIPNELVQTIWNSNLTVLVNENEPLYIWQSNNQTHTSVYFTYENSENEVTIIPELPNPMFPPMLMILTFLAATLWKIRKPFDQKREKADKF